MRTYQFPNKESVSNALRVYLNAMRPFAVRCLKRKSGGNLDGHIRKSLHFDQINHFEDALRRHGGRHEDAIDHSSLRVLVDKNWKEICGEEFRSVQSIRSEIHYIANIRNEEDAHYGSGDTNAATALTCLNHIVNVLGYINDPDANGMVVKERDKVLARFASDMNGGGEVVAIAAIRRAEEREAAAKEAIRKVEEYEAAAAKREAAAAELEAAAANREAVAAERETAATDRESAADQREAAAAELEAAATNREAAAAEREIAAIEREAAVKISARLAEEREAAATEWEAAAAEREAAAAERGAVATESICEAKKCEAAAAEAIWRAKERESAATTDEARTQTERWMQLSSRQQSCWVNVVHSLGRTKGQNRNLGALLRNCEDVHISYDGSRMLLQFKSKTHMDWMVDELSHPQIHVTVEDAIGKCFGASCELQLTMVGTANTW